VSAGLHDLDAQVGRAGPDAGRELYDVFTSHRDGDLAAPGPAEAPVAGVTLTSNAVNMCVPLATKSWSLRLTVPASRHCQSGGLLSQGLGRRLAGISRGALTTPAPTGMQKFNQIRQLQAAPHGHAGNPPPDPQH